MTLRQKLKWWVPRARGRDRECFNGHGIQLGKMESSLEIEAGDGCVVGKHPKPLNCAAETVTLTCYMTSKLNQDNPTLPCLVQYHPTLARRASTLPQA